MQQAIAAFINADYTRLPTDQSRLLNIGPFQVIVSWDPICQGHLRLVARTRGDHHLIWNETATPEAARSQLEKAVAILDRTIAELEMSRFPIPPNLE